MLILRTLGSDLLDKFMNMRPPNPSVAHDDVFDVFKASLGKCLSDHTECAKPGARRLPTRVLLLEDKEPERVFLHECEPEEQGKYVALSYCWGKTPQTMLLKSNVDDFQEKGIEVRTLPKTIQDGITATRKLGTKYLWIDSLCIIQDSPEDKDKEIVGMANIYKNATVTISAAATQDCGDGFLEKREDVQLRIDKSMCLPLMSTSDLETRVVLDYLHLCPEARMGHKLRRFADESINTRAWTYQESTLAPRLLIFGSGPPQWHCKESWKIYGLNISPEDLPHPVCVSTTMKITLEDGRIKPEDTLKYQDRPDPPKDEIGLWPEWFPLLEDYSHRALSFRTDKLLAVSALAAEHQSPKNGNYAAGLWSSSLPRGLLWRRSDNVELQTAEVMSNPGYNQEQTRNSLSWLRARLFDTCSPKGSSDPSPWQSQYVAPTWSPMSSSSPLVFEAFSMQKEDDFHTSLVTINHVHTSLTSSLNPFGRLDFSYLDITAPMRSLSWTELTATFVIVSFGEPFAYWDFIVPDDPAYFQWMSEKYAASFNPQRLADTSLQDAVDEGSAGIFVGDQSVRIQLRPIPEVASQTCAESTEPFVPAEDVRKELLAELLRENPSTSSSGKSEKSNRRCCWPSSSSETTPATQSPTGQPVSERDDCEFFLLEVERSMTPAGLVLKRVRGSMFARIGYFGMNRSIDPEIVILSSGIQVRGPRTFNWGNPQLKDDWNKSLTRKRIYLV